MTEGFIELYRTFRDLDDENVGKEEASYARLFHLGAETTWDDLLKNHRVVILSEAGSGKTEEIRAAATKLRNSNRAAFFLRLERLAIDLEDAFEVGTYVEFDAWLRSGEECWLFLDSVDEARLRSPSDFESAIRSIARTIALAKDRTHIFITGRGSARRPRTDLALCDKHLSYSSTCAVEAADDTANPERSKRHVTVRKKEAKAFRFVALQNLTADQIRVYAQARGVSDVARFIDEVDRTDAWSFTERPQDLQELADYWIVKKSIGSRLDLMQYSVARRLSERSQNRAESKPLKLDRIEDAVRLLAAAVALMQTQTLRPDGEESGNGIVTREKLTGWDEADLPTLLQRPIFDGAIYGTLRFHHRSVREYLAAVWINLLLIHGAPRRRIEDLFFRVVYGRTVVVPTLRPLLPWLILWDHRLRQRVFDIAPEVVFEGGDPKQLPVGARRKILADVCAQMAQGGSGSARDYAAVQRFAGAELADDIRALIHNYQNNSEVRDRRMADKITKQSADRWNERHPRGARVRVISFGVAIGTATASHAQQWGDLALLTLRDVPGLWTINAVEPLG